MIFTDCERKVADLAFLKAIPLMCRAKPGRLKGLSDKLGEQVDARRDRLPELIPYKALFVKDRISEFSDGQGKWQTRGAHVCTYCSFCLALIDGRPWPELKETLREIIDYFERVDKMPAPSCWAGDLAKEKFDRVMA